MVVCLRLQLRSWGCVVLLLPAASWGERSDEYVRSQLYKDKRRLQGRAHTVHKVCTILYTVYSFMIIDDMKI